jgi:hypothetical protein
MFGLRTRAVISKDLEKSTNEIERLTQRVSDMRKELVLADKDPEIQAILEVQPIGSVLRDGAPATPHEVLEERLGTDFVNLQHATDITDTYRDLRASLKVQDRNVQLASYGDDSMSAKQLMRKLYASEVLRELLRYKNENIGRFITIDSTGYVSIIR